MSRIKRQLSYANVVATLALLLALGAGTVVAASRINGKTIKKGSLPGNRLKRSSVKGGQVAESTLSKVPSAQAADAANAAIGVIKDGPVSLPFANTTNRIAELSLPIGKFFVTGKLVAHNDGAAPANDVECYLFAGADNFDKAIFDLGAGGYATVPLETVLYFPRPNSVVIDCNRHGDSVSVSFARLQAISAADIQRTSSP